MLYLTDLKLEPDQMERIDHGGRDDHIAVIIIQVTRRFVGSD